MPKSKIFFVLLLAFLAGVAVRSFAAIPDFLVMLAALAGLSFFIAGISRRAWEKALLGIFVVAFCLGVVRFVFAEKTRPDLSIFYGRNIKMAGIVWEDAVFTEQTQRVKVRIDSTDGVAVQPFLLLVTVPKYPHYHPGERIAINGKVEKPENFGEFDYAAYLAKDHVFAVSAFPSFEKLEGAEKRIVRSYLSFTRKTLGEKIDEILPRPHSAFLRALLLGERYLVPRNLVEDFNRSGTRHIIALSGMHVSLISAFFLAVLLYCRIPYYGALWIAGTGIVLYVIMTGAAPSVTRAGIMGLMILIAAHEGRMYGARNALAAAAAGMVWHNPMILRLDAGFHLSFAATIGLVMLAPRTEAYFEKIKNKFLSLFSGKSAGLIEKDFTKGSVEREELFGLKSIIVATIAAQTAVLPLLIYYFGNVSLISPVANLLVLAAVPYAMALGFFAGVLGIVWTPLGHVLGAVVWMLLEYKIRVIGFFASLPAAYVSVPSWILFPLLLFYAWGFWKLAFTARHGNE